MSRALHAWAIIIRRGKKSGSITYSTDRTLNKSYVLAAHCLSVVIVSIFFMTAKQHKINFIDQKNPITTRKSLSK